jgi:hypothetical protein
MFRGKFLAILFLTVLSLFCGHSQVLSQQNAVYSWKEVDHKLFSFNIPPDFQPQKVEGIDSAVWRYNSDDLVLIVELGIYAGKTAIYSDWPEYREERVTIGGRKAILCFFKAPESRKGNYRYFAAAYFEDIGKKSVKLSFFANCRSPREQAVARSIFRSIKFKRLSK